MTLHEGMPADPWSAIEESNLQRDIAAVDHRKRQEGITWGQYLGSTLVLFGMTEQSKHEVFRRCINDIGCSDLLVRIQEAERLESSDLPELKREVVAAIRDVSTLQRELMQIELPKET